MKELIAVLNLPSSLAAVCRTSDGYYIARAKGDIGFNQFLGAYAPHPGPGRDRSRQTFRAFTWGQKRAAVKQARKASVPLRTFLGV